MSTKAVVEVPSGTNEIFNVLPENPPELIEWSLLAFLAVFLIKGIWAEHQENEKAERELTNKLIDRLLRESDGSR